MRDRSNGIPTDEPPPASKDDSQLRQKQMIGAHYDRLAESPRTGEKNVYTFVPGNLTELLRSFDLLPVLPEINALQSAMRGKSKDYIALAENQGDMTPVRLFAIAFPLRKTVKVMQGLVWEKAVQLSQHHTQARSRPLRCYKEWPVPEPAILSNMVSALLSCGNCEYAGSPSAPLGPGFQKPVMSLVQALGSQDPGQEGILVYSGGAYKMAQSVAMANRALPSALFLDPLYARELLPAKPVHGRKTFVLWEGHLPLPSQTDLVRLTREPLTFQFGPDVRLPMHLYRAGTAGSWPHERSSD